VFERFTKHGRQVVVLAQDEARSMGHQQIGSEHLLLGLLRVDDELVEILGQPDDARKQIVDLAGLGESSPDQIPFSDNAMSVLGVVADESVETSIGPSQIALVLLALPADAKAIRALGALAVDIDDARERILSPPSIDAPGTLGPLAKRILDTAVLHAEDVPVAPEHLVLALVLEVPDLTRQALGLTDGGVVGVRLAGLLDGPERLHAPMSRRTIAVLEAALRNAEREGIETVGPVDLLLGLIEVAPDVVARASVDLEAAAISARVWRTPGADRMQTQFSVAARQAIALAHEEARRLAHSYIGTEHLLLGLLQDERGAAGRVLADLRVGLREARRHVEEILGTGDTPPPPGQLPFTPRTSRVFELAAREVWMRPREAEVDTGHLLLGIERAGAGVAVRVLDELGASRAMLRRRTLEVLDGVPVQGTSATIAPSGVHALELADAEAAELGHAWTGCEHLLLALTRRTGAASRALASFGITTDTVLSGLVDLAGVGSSTGRTRTPRLIRTVRTAEQLALAKRYPQATDAELAIALARESAGLARTLLGPDADEDAVRGALGDSWTAHG
jgi:ATP-dependent Clp protease ATP-binding subunit ClpA